jgi:hypothetical protein
VRLDGIRPRGLANRLRAAGTILLLAVTKVRNYVVPNALVFLTDYRPV